MPRDVRDLLPRHVALLVDGERFESIDLCQVCAPNVRVALLRHDLVDHLPDAARLGVPPHQQPLVVVHTVQRALRRALSDALRRQRAHTLASAYFRLLQVRLDLLLVPIAHRGDHLWRVHVHERAQQAVGNQFRRQRLAAAVSDAAVHSHALDEPMHRDRSVKRLVQQSSVLLACALEGFYLLRLHARGVESVVAVDELYDVIAVSHGAVCAGDDVLETLHQFALRVPRLRRLDGGIDQPRAPTWRREHLKGVSPSR